MRIFIFVFFLFFSLTTLADINIGVTEKVKTISSNYTALISDDNIMVDATSGNVTVGLPSASLKRGKVIKVFKTDGAWNTVSVGGTDLWAQGDTVKFISSGTSWLISDLRRQTAFARYTIGTALSINTIAGVLAYQVLGEDNQLGYNTSTGVYTTKRGGLVKVWAQYASSAIALSTTQEACIYVYINGSSRGYRCIQGNGASISAKPSIYTEYRVNKGDVIEIDTVSAIAANTVTAGATQNNILTIEISD